MKKKLLILSVIALLSVAVLGTWAYFTAEETTTNEISTGAVDLELYELGEGEPYTDGDTKGMIFRDVMPGADLHKEPRIKNTDSTQSFYTRACVTVDITLDENNAAIADIPPADCLRFNVDPEKWVKSGEWYYYKGAVEPGKEVVLFNKVSISPEMGNKYQNCSIDIKVEAQAVQVKNNEVEKYNGDYTKIQGWPAKPEI